MQILTKLTLRAKLKATSVLNRGARQQLAFKHGNLRVDHAVEI